MEKSLETYLMILVSSGDGTEMCLKLQAEAIIDHKEFH